MPSLWRRYVNRSQERAVEVARLDAKRRASWERMKAQVAAKWVQASGGSE